MPLLWKVIHSGFLPLLFLIISLGLSTAAVFKALNLSACSRTIPESVLDCFTERGVLEAARDGRLINDLEAPAFQVNPELLKMKDCIAKYESLGAIAGVMMSGSGE